MVLQKFRTWFCACCKFHKILFFCTSAEGLPIKNSYHLSKTLTFAFQTSGNFSLIKKMESLFKDKWVLLLLDDHGVVNPPWDVLYL